MTKWELDSKIHILIEDNCKITPFEGLEIDKHQLKQDFIDFIKQLTITDLMKIHDENL